MSCHFRGINEQEWIYFKNSSKWAFDICRFRCVAMKFQQPVNVMDIKINKIIFLTYGWEFIGYLKMEIWFFHTLLGSSRACALMAMSPLYFLQNIFKAKVFDRHNVASTDYVGADIERKKTRDKWISDPISQSTLSQYPKLSCLTTSFKLRFLKVPVDAT